MSITRRNPVPSDIEIAQEARIKPIVQVAEDYGICDECIDHFGKYKAKVRLEFLKQNADAPKRAKYIDVTAISPTPLGEGKRNNFV